MRGDKKNLIPILKQDPIAVKYYFPILFTARCYRSIDIPRKGRIFLWKTFLLEILLLFYIPFEKRFQIEQDRLTDRTIQRKKKNWIWKQVHLLRDGEKKKYYWSTVAKKRGDLSLYNIDARKNEKRQTSADMEMSNYRKIRSKIVQFSHHDNCWPFSLNILNSTENNPNI